MKLKDLIVMPWEYNFEFECGDDEYKELETIERYFTYKITPGTTIYEDVNAFIDKHRRYLNIYDADGSEKCFYPLIHEIYKKLWGWERSNKTFGNAEGWDSETFWGCDTINSVQTALNSLAKKLTNEITDLPEQKGKFSFNYILECWLSNNKFKNRLNRQRKLEEYINAYHTLGNFVLVPAGFNGQRGTSLKYKGIKINDFWDLSLKYLKDNGYGDLKPEMFKQYINYFFLWDYVNADYSIKPLSPENPDNLNEIKKFFEMATERIYRRGKFMTAMLIIATEATETLYKDIQEKIIDQNDIKGIDGAAEYILKNFEDKLKDEKYQKARDLLEKLEGKKI